MKHAIFAVAATLSLSACNAQDPEAASEQSAAPETQMPADAAPHASSTIPVRFQGAWDYEGGNCDLASDMRMEISGDGIVFYESVGKVTGVAAEGDDVIVSLDMEGEGETWQHRTRFSLVGGGDDVRLQASEGDAPRQVDKYPRKRCPA